MLRLNELAPGGVGHVAGLETEVAMRRRLLELGLVAGTRVRCLGRSPLGDPSAYEIRGAVIALRDRDSAGVLVGGEAWDLSALPLAMELWMALRP